MKKVVLFALFVFLSGFCSAQILNGSFENWSHIPNVGPEFQPWSADNWVHCNKLGYPREVVGGFPATYKDSIAFEGQHALRMSRWYQVDFDVVKFLVLSTGLLVFISSNLTSS